MTRYFWLAEISIPCCSYLDKKSRITISEEPPEKTMSGITALLKEITMRDRSVQEKDIDVVFLQFHILPYD